MSIIVAKVTDKYITMIADTQRTNGSYPHYAPGVKMFRTPSAIVGFAGLACYGLILQDILQRFPLVDHSDMDVLDFIDRLRDAAAARGLTYTSDDHNAIQMILASPNRVTEISGYAMCEVTDFTAIGSAEEAARALLTANIDVFDATVIAAKQDIYCSPPFEVYEIKRSTGTVFYELKQEDRTTISSHEAELAYSESDGNVEEVVYTAQDKLPFTIEIKNTHVDDKEDGELSFPADVVF